MLYSKHNGFSKTAEAIHQKEHVSMGAAKAILASASRKASPAAKRANPNLRKVKGGY